MGACLGVTEIITVNENWDFPMLLYLWGVIQVWIL